MDRIAPVRNIKALARGITVEDRILRALISKMSHIRSL